MFQRIYNVLGACGGSLGRADTEISFYQLSQLLSAGVPVADALNDLVVDNPSHTSGRHWQQIARSVCAGNSLSDALSKSRMATDKTLMALLTAGEASGELDAACQAIYQYLKWHRDLRQRTITLLIYPMFSLCVLVGVTGFLFISVVPSIEGFLSASAFSLAWHTRLLIDVSTWMERFYLDALIAGLVTAALFCVGWVFSSRSRKAVDSAAMKVPLLGRVASELLLSRYVRCIAQLYQSGVALETALALAEQTVSNRYMRYELSKARQSMVNGASLAESMKSVTVLPVLFNRLVAIGENSGRLAEALFQLADQQSAAAETSIKRVEQSIGPILLLVVGVMLLWIVVSVLGPVYNMAIATVVGAV